MENIHSLLKRQIKRHFGEKFDIPGEWREFVSAIDDAYRGFDDDREMLERSLELSSQELLQANSQLRALFQAIPDLLFRLNHEGTILDFKSGSTSDLLLAQQDFLGKRIQDIPIQHVGDQFRKAIRQVFEEGIIVNIEYSLTLHRQKYLYEARLLPTLENEIVVIIRNITERKRAEDSLLKFSRVVEQTADSVFITNFAGIIEYVNPAFEELTGYTMKELAGKTPRVLKSDRHEKEIYADLWSTILRGETYRDILINRKKNGELYYAEKTITPIKDGDGSIKHFVSTEKDITARRELEAQLRQSQKMEAFGQLAAGVAHDFNNILTVILGNLSLLRTGALSEAETQPAIGHAVQAAERAANLTRQLLTFSRRQPLQPKNLDLNEVVANITKMLQRLIGEDISMETRYAPGGAVIHADADMMEQVLMNLAVNSRDAMPNGGRLMLQTALVVVGKEQREFKHNVHPGEYVRLSVSDTGSGIAPEHLPHIFEPFFTTKEVGRGTGLGLATVFGIVEQHSGWIDVESNVNSGTTFHIYLPHLAHRANALEESEREPVVRGGSETILLVEDDDAVRKLMHSMLARCGYHVHEAGSGVKALPIWQEHRAAIDLLITDMVMPGGVSGRELSDRFKSEKPALKIIQCSGYTNEVPGKDVCLANNIIFLEKPFDPHKFLQRVRDNLDGR